MAKNPRTIVATILVTLLVIFTLQNIRGATVRFVIWDATLPIALVVAVSFGLGFGIAWFWKRR